MQENKTVQLTEDEAAEYQRLKEAEAKRREEAKLKEARKEFRAMAEEAVDEVFGEIKHAEGVLRDTKLRVLGAFHALLDLKVGELGTRGEQGSYAFMNKAQTRRITIGRYKKFSYDATAEDGIEKVKGFLSSLGDNTEDEDKRKLVSAVLDLLSKDRYGHIQPDKILELERLVDKFGDEQFTRGVAIIKESLIFGWTKVYFRAEEKGDMGAWRTVKLSMINV